MMNMCALALVLLLDVSSSVTAARYDLQKQGLLSSFRDPVIQRLMLNQAPGGMAITIYEWSTYPQQAVPWIHIRSQADLNQLIEHVEHLDRKQQDGVTAVGRALLEGINSFDHAPCDATRKIIDISGDGANNSGKDPDVAKQQAQDQGITINGLPILNDAEPDLEAHYREHVITHDGFVMPSEGFEDFARALRRKLILEIATKQ